MYSVLGGIEYTIKTPAGGGSEGISFSPSNVSRSSVALGCAATVII
jgi:hypothetical protein